MTIHPYFAALIERAGRTPHSICCELFGPEGTHCTLSFQFMRNGIASASTMFSRMGVNKGDTILIFAQHSPGMLLSFFGAQWLGAIPAFMPPPTSKQDPVEWAQNHQALVDRIRPALIVAEPSSMIHLARLFGAAVISSDEVTSAPESDDVTPCIHHSDLDRIAFLQHSSGTTGLKKGVIVTYSQLLAQLDNYAKSIAFDRHSQIVTWLPLYHDMGLIAATLMPFYFGASMKIIDTFTWLSGPEIFMRLLASTPNAYAWLPNFAFNYLAKRVGQSFGPDAFSRVQAIINCSEPCKIQDMRAFLERFEPNGLRTDAIQICYAMAEYVFAVTQTPLGATATALELNADVFERYHRAEVAVAEVIRKKSVVCVGSPIEGAEVRIGNAKQDGDVGEIFVRGPSTCRGYFRNEELSRSKFISGWYNTGDLGFLYNGSLYVTGRTDDLIIVRGKNVYAHDLESIASSVPGVKEGRAVALGIDDTTLGTQNLILVAEVESSESLDLIRREIARRSFDAFGIVPTQILLVALNSLVKTTSGKISRSENMKRFVNGTLVSIEHL